MFEILLLVLLAAVGIALLIIGFWILRRDRKQESGIASIMYSLTHDEISNPVQSALATVVNLENRLQRPASDSDNATRHDIASLRKSLTRLAEVTRNLRALVLLELPQTSRVSERVNLVGLIQGLIVELGDKADREKVRIAYEGGDSPIVVLAKKDDLVRLFTNLIDNSIKYSREVEHASVVVSITRHKRQVQVDISDNGVGISCDRLLTLGQAPQRPDAQNIGTRGAGLGLFLTRKIVTSYQGTVTINSAENRGTTISIKLPLHRE